MNSRYPSVLIVEDTREIAEMVAEFLRGRHCETRIAGNVYQAREELKRSKADVVVLDWMLPGPSGLDLLSELVEQPEPRPRVILLTARAEEGDVVHGLDTGADDYVTKPFSLPELYARINRLVRPASSGEFVIGRARINPGASSVTVDGVERDFSEIALRLLVFFHSNPNTVHSRRELIRGAWPPKTHVSDRTVDVHISHLRKFLKEECGINALRTVRNEGYKFALGK